MSRLTPAFKDPLGNQLTTLGLLPTPVATPTTGVVNYPRLEHYSTDVFWQRTRFVFGDGTRRTTATAGVINTTLAIAAAADGGNIALCNLPVGNLLFVGVSGQVRVTGDAAFAATESLDITIGTTANTDSTIAVDAVPLDAEANILRSTPTAITLAGTTALWQPRYSSQVYEPLYIDTRAGTIASPIIAYLNVQTEDNAAAVLSLNGYIDWFWCNTAVIEQSATV